MGLILQCFALILPAPGSAHAAAPPSASTSFEVASIRPSTPGCCTSIGPYGTPNLMLSKVSLKLLISFAYGIDSGDFEGDMKGLDDVSYDIAAKADGNTALTYELLKPMLQDLLQQRFHLVAHTAVLVKPGYALLVAKGGPKIQPSTEPPGGGDYVMPNEIRIARHPMHNLAGMLRMVVHRPVADRTELSGDYDITLHYAPELLRDSGAPDAGAAPTLPSIFTALPEQLGLELKPAKVQVSTLVIEHIDRTPTPN